MYLASKPAEQQVLLIVTLCSFLPEFFLQLWERVGTQNAFTTVLPVTLK